MRGLQSGSVAPQGLGFVQAAQRGSGGGGFVFGVFDALALSNVQSQPRDRPSLDLLAEYLRIAPGIAGGPSNDLACAYLPQKVPFFNGLLGGIVVLDLCIPAELKLEHTNALWDLIFWAGFMGMFSGAVGLHGQESDYSFALEG